MRRQSVAVASCAETELVLASLDNTLAVVFGCESVAVVVRAGDIDSIAIAKEANCNVVVMVVAVVLDHSDHKCWVLLGDDAQVFDDCQNNSRDLNCQSPPFLCLFALHKLCESLCLLCITLNHILDIDIDMEKVISLNGSKQG